MEDSNPAQRDRSPRQRTPLFLPSSRDPTPWYPPSRFGSESGLDDLTSTRNVNNFLPVNINPPRDGREAIESSQDHRRRRRDISNRFVDIAADESDGEGGITENRDDSSDDEERVSDREFVDDSPQNDTSFIYTRFDEDIASGSTPAPSFRQRAAAYAADVTKEAGESSTHSTERGATPPWVLRQRTPPPLAKFITGASAPLAGKGYAGDWVRIRTHGHHFLIGFAIDANSFLVPNQKPDPNPLNAPHLQCLRIRDPSKVTPIVPPAWYDLAPRQRLPHQAMLECTSLEELAPFLRDSHPALLTLTHHTDSPALLTLLPCGTAGILSHLRWHALDFSYAFQINDRVQSVSSGATGRVTEVDYQNLLVYVARENGSRFKVGIDEVVRMWEPGDSVRVRWGEHFLRAGFIVNVLRGGFLDIFDPHFPVVLKPNQWSEENKASQDFRVRAADVDFDTYEDNSHSLTAQQRHSSGAETGDMQGGKNRLHHLQVLVTGKHFYKGLREGLGNPEYGLEKRNPEGILLTIRKERSNELVQNIRIEDVVHEQTMLPLIQALSLPPAVLSTCKPPTQLYGFPAEVPPPRPTTPHTSSISDVEEVPSIPSFNDRDGSWLSIAELNMKRLDVQIVGTDSLKKASKKLQRCKGQFGHLLLEGPVDSLDKKVVVYGVGPSRIRPSVPKECVIPRRENDVGHWLWEIRERVVVLRPDVWGDVSRRGLYAETMPEVEHGLGPEIAAVVFEGGREVGFFNAQPLLPVSQCICR
ncbi:hypothetical protein R3P38DRAFT_3237417 [Favolaschia claudopus]|uniref:Uncharacterized protein n=1 Tax=Favolaschia claudopus TaxID=2862362 RepID=A0AAV9ZAU3_9AGAR